jgi:hypothetical protein
MSNDQDYRPGATGVRPGTEALSPGSVHIFGSEIQAAFLLRAFRACCLIGVIVSGLSQCFAATLAPFTFVIIDAQTEALYGSLPFDRAVIATAIDKLTAAKAKGIVLKFFYDLPSTEKNDVLLEQSICNSMVALQASLNESEGTTNSLEAKFQVAGESTEGFPPLFVGNKALVPLKRFRRCAKAIGFVDSIATDFPLFEGYQGKVVKSLQLVALEMASSQKAEIDDSGLVKLGPSRLEAMHAIEFPVTNSLSYIPLHEVVGDTSKAWRRKVQGSVVILGYDGKKIDSIQTLGGPLGAHRFFITSLLSLAKAFEKGNVAK